jgi:hypothetical protein
MRLTKKRKEPEKPEPVSIPTLQPASDNEGGNLSPTKQGILMTPGTVRGKKKEVTFGSQVVDNEGKKISRSGIPNDCPGKWPSPWTPKTTDATDEKRPKTKLTEALYEAKHTGTTPGTRRREMRSKDDADITIDIMEPRSESGRHWKEMYIELEKKSEEQVGKLTAKYKLCKEHARRKDDESAELRRQLESGSKKHKAREKELDKQIKELREQLRLQMAENAKTSTEISLLRKQLGEFPLESSTSKLKRALQKFETTKNDSIWVDEAAREDDNAKTKTYLQAAVIQSRGEQARSTRAGRERRLAHKEGTIRRQDSVVTPSGKVELDDNMELELSPTPKASRDIKKPLRRILGDMSPNVPSSPPMPSFFSESDHERIIDKISKPTSDSEGQNKRPRVHSPTHREAMAEAAASLSKKQDFSILEDLAPMSALSLQAEQPVTPVSIMRKQSIKAKEGSANSRRHNRSEAASGLLNTPAGLDDTRMRAAKERLEARRAKRHARVR